VITLREFSRKITLSLRYCHLFSENRCIKPELRRKVSYASNFCVELKLYNIVLRDIVLFRHLIALAAKTENCFCSYT